MFFLCKGGGGVSPMVAYAEELTAISYRFLYLFYRAISYTICLSHKPFPFQRNKK